jgi:hypothetical protein
MFSNIKRIIVSGAAVQAAFVAYRLLAVPLIEPSVAERAVPVDPVIVTKPSENSLQLYAGFFPPGSWELKDPIELDSDNSKLLMQRYQNLPGNQVRLDPCTVIFVPDGVLDADPATHRVIVLQAPQGALLKFDQPVDFQSGKIGRLLGGEFPGPITIRGTPSRLGADDNLQIVTSDVHMTTERIWNSAPVQFHFGAHSGSGRDLVIHLLPAASNKPQSAFSMGGLESFELLHDVQMRMVPGRGGIMPMDPQHHGAAKGQHTENGPEHPGVSNLGDPSGRVTAAGAMTSMPRLPPGMPAPIPLAGSDDEMGAATQRAAAIPPSAPNTPENGQPRQPSAPSKPHLPDPPVDIRCAGPFRFDMVHNVATFDEQVDVVRVFVDGTTDHMNSDWLAIHLAPKQPPIAPSGSSDSATTVDKHAPQSNDQQNSIQQRATNSCNATGSAGSSIQSDGAKQKVPSLQPSRLEARGKPVIIRAPSNSAYIRCEHLDYDLLTSQLTVEDSNEAIIQQLTNEIHCRFVVYRPGEPGHLGQLLANGPGWLRGTPPATATDSKAGPATARNAPPRLFEAHWTESLKMRPYESRHVISLLGGARAGFSGQGELSADEIHLWLIEPADSTVAPATAAAMIPGNQGAPAAAKSQPQPDRMLAQGHVHINSPQMVGNTGRLEAWFEQATGPSPALATALSGDSPLGGSRSASAAGATNANAAAGGAVGRSAGPNAGVQNPTPSQYQVDGERIRVQFLVRPEATEVENLSVDNQVRLVEIHPANPGDLPLVVTGDRLEVLRANAVDTDVTVHGRPGQVGARGLEMYGATIRLNKGSNRLWIDGPGRMKLPANSGAGGNDLLGMGQPRAGTPGATSPAPQAPVDPMFVNWQGRMDFDGQTAHFERQIVGQSSTRNMKTDNLDVVLRQRVVFAQMRPQDQTQVGRILCHGQTLMESRAMEQDKLASIDRMQVRDLMVDEVTGLVEGQGPGWITSVRHGDDNLMGPMGQPGGPKPQPITSATQPPTGPGAPGAAAASGSQAAHAGAGRGRTHGGAGAPGHGAHHAHPSHHNSIARQDHLNYLNVQFSGPLTGNLNQHEFTLHDQVHTIYGPVLSWNDQLNSDNIDDLDDGDALINCDQLTVRQGEGYITSPPTTNAQGVPQPPPAPHHPLELEAVGNTMVEATNFTARSNRMTYAEAKDLLVLEGDGRRDAELYRQDQPGAPDSSTIAKRILFWRSTNRVSVNDAKFFNLDQPSDPADSKDPKKANKAASKLGPGVASPLNPNLAPR